MLNARHAVVEFTGRDAEMAELREWRDDDGRLAPRWLHGPGGIGKTRLADRLAAESVVDGWVVVVATHGPASVFPPPGSQDLRVPDGALVAAQECIALLDLRWELGDPAGALRDGYAACEIMRRLTARHPLRYGASLAGTLAALGVRLVEVEQPQEALSATAEAIFLYGELEPSAREAILPDVANALMSFTYVRLVCGVEPDDALAAAAEAVAVHEHLARTNPTGYGEELIRAYLAYAQVLDVLDRPAEAHEIRRRAAALEGPGRRPA